MFTFSIVSMLIGSCFADLPSWLKRLNNLCGSKPKPEDTKDVEESNLTEEEKAEAAADFLKESTLKRR